MPALADAHRIVDTGASFTVADLERWPAPIRWLIPLVRHWRSELEAEAQKQAYDRERFKAKSRGGR